MAIAEYAVEVKWNYSPTDVTFMDVETQSALNVRAVGGKQYVRDPSTRLLSAVFKRNGELVSWIPKGRAPYGIEYHLESCKASGVLPSGEYVISDTVPDKVQQWIANGTTFIAHNAEAFDGPFWTRHIKQDVTWFDTIHLCRLHGLPASLDAACKAIGGKGKADDDAMRLLTNVKVHRKTGALSYPVGTERLWQALIKYNIEDVNEMEALYLYLTSLPIPDTEREMLNLNWQINQRGVRINLEFARRLRDAWAKSKLESVDELVTLTDGALNKDNIGSPKQVKAYLASLGLVVDSLDKRIINQILENPEQFIERTDSDDAQKALAVLVERQNAVRSTIGKIDRLFKVVDEDETVRNCIVYYGAHTGRFSGRDLQPHNFPRGLQFSSEPTEAKQLLSGAFETDDLLAYAKIIAEKLQASAKTRKERREATVANVLATLTRGVITAREGHEFAIADYAAVEARGIGWVARCNSMLDAFSDVKKDIYLDMASKLFGRTCTKKDKEERFIGKQIVLGCIAEGTPILTDSGWKPIENIKLTDRLWDGVEYVAHDGVVFSGVKQVSPIGDVWLTRDHKVLTQKGWVEACQLNANTHCLPSTASMENGRLFLLNSDQEADCLQWNANAHAEQFTSCYPATSFQANQRGVMLARMSHQGRRNQSMQTSYRTLTIENGYSIVSALRTRVATTQNAQHTKTMAAGEYAYSLPTDARFSPISSRYPDGITHNSKLTGSTITDTTRHSTCNFQQDQNRMRIVATFDILNVGERNRFQAGNLIVHNCGYQMAAPKFDAGCKVYLVDLAASGVTAEDCVMAYRKGYPEVPQVWRAYQDAAMYCIKNRQSINAGRCTFTMDGNYLCMRLPSGRLIRYRNAAVELLPPKWNPSGAPIEQITFQSAYGFRKGLYGGLLAENAVQGLCRDLLRDAMREVSKTYPVVLHVHDEILIEAPKEQAESALHLLCKIMSTPPKWAENFPIRVEGFTNRHYTKSAVCNSHTADYLKGVSI